MPNIPTIYSAARQATPYGIAGMDATNGSVPSNLPSAPQKPPVSAPDLAHVLQLPQTQFPGYMGQEPYTLAQQQRDVAYRSRDHIYGPASMTPNTGIDRGGRKQSAQITDLKTTTHLPDYGPYAHPVMLQTASGVPLKSPPSSSVQLQLFRNGPVTSFMTTYQAPSINEINKFLGGCVNG